MTKIIDNPFKEEWEEFDIEAMKESVSEIIDSIAESKDPEEFNELLDILDDVILYFTTLASYKDEDVIEVISMTDIPIKNMLESGLTREEISSFEESDYIPLRQAQELFNLRKKKDNPSTRGWKL